MNNKKLTIEFVFKGIKKRTEVKKSGLTLEALWDFLKTVEEWQLVDAKLTYSDSDGVNELDDEDDFEYLIEKHKAKVLQILVNSENGKVLKSSKISSKISTKKKETSKNRRSNKDYGNEELVLLLRLELNLERHFNYSRRAF